MAGTKITKFHVGSSVQCRFATTTITSVVSNLESVAREIVFKAVLPNSAFICHFSMTVDGKLIVAEVKEKVEAKRKYVAAKAKGQTAGLAAQSIRETNTFEISTNVSANGSALFELTYQEILQRVNGVYKHVININPGQVVDDMRIDVAVAENAEITKFKVPSVGPNIGEKINTELMALPDSPDVKITKQVTKKRSPVSVSYVPTAEQQREQLGQGVSGQLVVLYDVDRNNSSGEIEVVDGYFVHFFAPSGLPTGSKRVLFVLDQSGSMQGSKISQLKTAMKAILAEVREIDFFNIITFSYAVNVWRPGMITATPANIQEAQSFIDRMPAEGGTAIYNAMQEALRLLDDPGTSGALSSLIVFLTDGEATIGETRPERIVDAISGWNATGKHRIHCVAFGYDAHYEMLKQISGRNSGVARKVFAESDAAIQLKGFYTEISSPLLADLSIKYIDETVDAGSLARSSDRDYVDGSEIMVLGRISGDQKQSAAAKPIAVIKGTVQGRGAAGECRYDISHPIVNGASENTSRDPTRAVNCPLPRSTVGGFVERMWAYLTIQKLLEQAKYSETDAGKQATLRKQALDLSLKYHFVSELTSLVVTQEQETNAVGDVSASDMRVTDQGGIFGPPTSCPPAMHGNASGLFGYTPHSAMLGYLSATPSYSPTSPGYSYQSTNMSAPLLGGNMAPTSANRSTALFGGNMVPLSANRSTALFGATGVPAAVPCSARRVAVGNWGSDSVPCSATSFRGDAVPMDDSGPARSFGEHGVFSSANRSAKLFGGETCVPSSANRFAAYGNNRLASSSLFAPPGPVHLTSSSHQAVPAYSPASQVADRSQDTLFQRASMATQDPTSLTFFRREAAASQCVAKEAVGRASTIIRPNRNAEIHFYEGTHLAMADSLDLSSFTFFGNTRTMQERISNLNGHSEIQRRVELRHLLEIAEEVSFYFQQGVCTSTTSALIDFEIQEKKANIAINFKGRLQLVADAGTGWITKIYFLFLEDSFDIFFRANGKPSSDSDKKRIFEEVFMHLILPELNLLMANPAI